MAKYDITYTCGHSGVEQLYGPGTERRKHIEWAEKNKACPDCYQAAQEKARAETAVQSRVLFRMPEPRTPAGHADKRGRIADESRTHARGGEALKTKGQVNPFGISVEKFTVKRGRFADALPTRRVAGRSKARARREFRGKSWPAGNSKRDFGFTGWFRP